MLAEREKIRIEEKYSDIFKGLQGLKGKTKEKIVKTRINQSVFRQIILSSYSNRCAISGINIPELLVASHIIPWSINKDERLNPSNGICLSSLYDKAFDTGLIGINVDYSILLSKKIKKTSNEEFYIRFFKPFNGKTILFPERYRPQKKFLEYHLDTIFQK